MQTAWNFSDYSVSQVEGAISRYNDNSQVLFPQLVNIHTWFLDILNNQARHLLSTGKLPVLRAMYVFVKEEYDSQYALGKPLEEAMFLSDRDNPVPKCDNKLCLRECFLYFGCKETKQSIYFYCVKCVVQMNHDQLKLYQNYQHKDIQGLFGAL